MGRHRSRARTAHVLGAREVPRTEASGERPEPSPHSLLGVKTPEELLSGSGAEGKGDTEEAQEWTPSPDPFQAHCHQGVPPRTGVPNSTFRKQFVIKCHKMKWNRRRQNTVLW